MSRIHHLPEDLVNKIAAGEVVERPASVVKELVENAIDAGASLVQVEIEAGGKSLIRVRDDGEGMSRADAELALERHATSKLATVQELQGVATHGFRGEALPSIASVSELVLRTREAGAALGTEVEVRHGRLGHVRDTGHPQGTTVEVRDLFGAVPARRKFQRSETTEAAHVAEAVSLLALARPAVGFFLKSGARSVIEAPAVAGLGPRLFQLFGGGLFASLVELEASHEWAQVSGFVSRPDGRRPPRPSLRLFVNHRPVRDRALAAAVSVAYRAAGAGGRGFDAFLFLDVPGLLVDVNVHPAKTEVRFADPRPVWTAVERGVRTALSRGARQAVPAGIVATGASLSRRTGPGPGDAEVHTASGPAASAPARSVLWPAEAREPMPGARPAAATEDAFAGGTASWLDPLGVSVIGQHRNTYVVATDGEELILVDQHTAHERVRYECLLDQLERRQPESQLLLSPLVVALPPELFPLVEAEAASLLGLGYDVEAFGGGAVRLRAVPSLLGGGNAGAALISLLRDFRDREGGEWAVSGTRERLAATLACHASVRAGQALATETMSKILRELLGTAHPTQCPHGRATLVRIPREDVSRWFGRKGWKRQ